MTFESHPYPPATPGLCAPLSKAGLRGGGILRPAQRLAAGLRAVHGLSGAVSRSLYDWPDKDLIHRKPAALEHWRKELSEEVEFHTFLQYLFFRQWHALKQYANEKGVGIIGDIPFYVSDNSVDVWCHPELFQVDQDCHAKLVAGVPRICSATKGSSGAIRFITGRATPRTVTAGGAGASANPWTLRRDPHRSFSRL